MTPREPRRALVLAAALLVVVAFTLFAAANAPAKVHWQVAGASVFGQPCDPGEVYGNRDNKLADRPLGFAELGPPGGVLLGHLAYLARIRVRDPQSNRSITLQRVDWGTGGGAVQGYTRRIDVLWPALKRLLKGRANCNWTGVLRWRLLPASKGR